jgi:hypothetical protein
VVEGPLDREEACLLSARLIQPPATVGEEAAAVAALTTIVDRADTAQAHIINISL